MARKLPFVTEQMVEEVLGREFETTAHDCHGTSIGIVAARPDWLPEGARVARGWCRGVWGQHSWIACGDPYEARTPIIDATLWSYDKSVSGVFVTRASDKRYGPHGGDGTVWQCSPPPEPEGEILTLSDEEYEKLSPEAKHFLDRCGPLDARGWCVVGDYPVRGWPSSEIWAAMWRSRGPRGVSAFTQIDRIGMATDIDPRGMYLGTKQDA
jgi:hypothetical protein